METDYCQKILLDLNHHYVADIYFWGLPGEVLNEVGLEIKRLHRPLMIYLQRYAP